MAKYGIRPAQAYGVSIPVLRAIAHEIGQNHILAGLLWDSCVREARILATMIEDPAAVTSSQAERWAAEFDSWEICDQCCNNLLRKTPMAYSKAVAWSARPEEFVKRAGFVLMAVLALHERNADEVRFEGFLEIIEAQASDRRVYVRKAVNWALRQIGKRNRRMNRSARRVAARLMRRGSSAASRVGSDALRELTSDAVLTKLASTLR